MLCLKCLNRPLTAPMILSYTPMDTAMVPPDTPGMMLATPMATPRNTSMIAFMRFLLFSLAFRAPEGAR